MKLDRALPGVGGAGVWVSFTHSKNIHFLRLWRFWPNTRRFQPHSDSLKTCSNKPRLGYSLLWQPRIAERKLKIDGKHRASYPT